MITYTLYTLHCYFCILYTVNCKEDNATELLQLHIIFRHGSKTTESFYPNDPNINNTFEPIGLGGLTNKGKMDEFQLGTLLRNEYNDFLGDIYNEKEVFVRSAYKERTIMSAQLVLAGLYPPKGVQLWNPMLAWQPIPVLYTNAEEEDLFHPFKYCPNQTKTMQLLMKNSEVKARYITPYLEFFKTVEQYSGFKIHNLMDLHEVYGSLESDIDMKLTVPDWVFSVFPEPMKTITSQLFDYMNFDQGMRRINSGYMLEKILNDCRSRIAGLNRKKIYLYSGHQVTVGYMLSALRVYKPHLPSYGSAMIFELHLNKTNSQHFIKLRYRNDTDSFIDLDIPNCTVSCPFETFVELQEDLLPTISVQEACQSKANINRNVDIYTMIALVAFFAGRWY